jgi:two-component system, NtrC family, sensor kinase
MASRTSLRKKLAYTFLAGALLTIALFSLVIYAIVNDYSQRKTAVSREFVIDQSTQAVRANLTVFKDRIQQTFASGAVALNSLNQSGFLGDRLERMAGSREQREETARILQKIQQASRLSFITIVDLNGRTVLRSTNPAAFGDEVLMGDYVNPNGPVSSIRHLMQTAFKGDTVTAWESFPPEILAPENFIKDGKVISSLREYVAIPLKGKDVTGIVETRALVLTYAAPVLDSQGKIAGAAITGRVINKDLSIVQDIRDLLEDQATVFFGQVRIATTRRSERFTVGTVRGDRRGGDVVDSGVYNEREIPRRVEGEEVMGVFDPVKDFDGVVLGSLYIGRPLSLVNAISAAQEDIENGILNKTRYYIIGLAIASVVIGFVIASIFSKRITQQIDQLRKGAETISDGNLDYRLEINSGDEIETLAAQFNSMAARLHDSYQTLENKVEERTRELKESQNTMIQQEKMVGIGQLAAGIAHELNTPLGTIIGYAQMLKEDLASQPSVNGSLGDVDEIIEQAGRCRDLVKNLLNFSRRSTTEKSQANINGIVRKILSLVEHDFEMKRVHVQVTLDPKLPEAKVNENEIAQVVLNLANNAVDSMPDGGDLHIRTFYDKPSDRVAIEVHDTGFGISESDRRRVFEPFFTTKEVGKGTGLGLSICYKIVENHMGTMEFNSVVGSGTTFTVYLPVNAEVRVG